MFAPVYSADSLFFHLLPRILSKLPQGVVIEDVAEEHFRSMRAESATEPDWYKDRYCGEVWRDFRAKVVESLTQRGAVAQNNGYNEYTWVIPGIPEARWKTVPDKMIRHVWVDGSGREHFVLPSAYAESGIPIDPDSGTDMTYDRTEISTNSGA